MFTLYHGDALEVLDTIPPQSVDLCIADPPYNVGIADWDKYGSGEYGEFTLNWIKKAVRTLTPIGSLYLWHNQIPFIAWLMEAIKREIPELIYNSFIVWYKSSFRFHCYCSDNNFNRSWFPVCEYLLYFNGDAGAGKTEWNRTGLNALLSNPELFQPLKKKYREELKRLGKSERELVEYYKTVTGKGDGMFRHYFKDTQFMIPTRQVWESVFRPFGFRQEYESLRQEYESLRQEYESLRYYHHHEGGTNNVYEETIPPGHGRHTCQKPVRLLRKMVRTSCRPGGTVLDPFAGSGTTGIAAEMEGRNYIGIEKDDHWYSVAVENFEKARTAVKSTFPQMTE